jgi:thiosulfate reductase cytochrome b subunit
MSIILALQGYIVALVALYVAFAPRQRKAHRAMRPALCLLALAAATISTLAMARLGGAGAVHFVSLITSFIMAAASIGWLLVSVVGSFQRPARQPRPASVDFSFLQAEAVDADMPATCRPKLNYRRWIARLQRIKFLNRWSYLSDPP